MFELKSAEKAGAFEFRGSSLSSQGPGSLTPPVTYSTFSQDQTDNFKVLIRVRPPLPREVDPVYGFHSVVQVSAEHKRISIEEYLGAATNDAERERDIEENPGLVSYHSFAFDYIFDQDSTQSQVYEYMARPAVVSVLEGYNATLLAYGQTGTGKTYTMEGFKYNSSDPQRGIAPRAIEDVFKFIESSKNVNITFMVRASYLQIYNEAISDLLKSDRGSLQIREEKRRGVFVEGLSEWAVRSPSDICTLMQKGQTSRATASTKMNDISSRSHAVFIIIIEQMSTVEYEDEVGKQIKVGKLNIVDLAGSERVRVTGATGKRLEESKKINQSLSALGNVIAALTDAKPRAHIPYRDSKLTRLLEDSLGGNCKTTMMANITPAYDSFPESLSSLKFANRAKNIKNDAHINEDVDQRALLRKYEVELKRLRSELESKNKSVFDMQKVMDLEDQKRQAEADKEAAIEALEMRSREYLNEKEQKKKLEERIKMMNSQLLPGGRKLEDTPQFRTALEERQKVIREEYENRLQDIERERHQIEEDKIQIDRYKQLLLRQRDIMIALTARLNERDETIIQQQDELDAYDRIYKETEEKLEAKAERVVQLQSIMQAHAISCPEEEPLEVYRVKEPRRYAPFSTEAVVLDSELVVPLQMLTAEEKIEEMNGIVEQQKEQIESLTRRAMRESQESRPDHSSDEKHQREKVALRTLLESSIMSNSHSEPVDSISAQIKEGTYQYSSIAQDVQSLQKAATVALTLLRTGDTPAAPVQKENTRLLPAKVEQKPPARSRPLTVDEMIMLKRQEMQKRHSENSS